VERLADHRVRRKLCPRGARATQHGSGSIALEVIEILLGLALAFAGVRQWRRRDQPRTSSGVSKKFTARLEQLNPWEAATVGILKQPWTLTAAAAVVLVRHHSAFPIVVLAFVVFAVLSTATVGLIFLYSARHPEEAGAHLSDLRDRLVRAGPVIFAIVSVAVGAYLAIDAVIGIVGS
jgi:hypothetical protein